MINTRPATDLDLHFLEDVFLRAMCAHITATRGFWNESSERNQFRQQLELEHTRIVDVDAIPIGFFMARQRGHDLELHTVCLAPEHQRRGIGTKVIQQVLRDAKAQRRSVVLSVLKPNAAARSLYERLGFVVTGETSHHYQMRFAQ